jgi:hypothetical protein
MDANNIRKEKEEKAIDALISAELFPLEKYGEVIEQDFKNFLSPDPVLPAEYESILDKIGEDISSRLFSDKVSEPKIEYDTEVEKLSQQFAAMNRNNASNKFDSKTEEELKRKREELLRKLKEKKRSIDDQPRN